MDLRSHVPPSGNLPRPATTLAADMLIIDALLMGERLPCSNPAITANDVTAAHQLRICAEALALAVDAMHASPAECEHDEVCNQLERVQEAAGRAIMATLEARRQAIIAGYLDDDDDLPDTVTLPETPPADADAKGGA